MPRADEAGIIAAWARRGRRLEVVGAGTTVWEDGTGDPVVCLHGVPSSAFLYRKVLPELAARGRRGVAFDFPGLGLADRPKEFNYSWSGLSAWTVKAIDALELDRFHLVVHDIGGPVGFDVVARIPDRVASLTALNTIVRVASFKRPWSMEPFARRGIGEVYLRTLHPVVFERLMRLQGVATAVPASELRAYVPLLKRKDGGGAFLRIMRSFERSEAFERRILAALGSRKFPAQVLWGEQDPTLKLDPYAEHVRQALAVETVTRLRGKHFVAEDAPQEIADHVSRLIDSADGGG
jgi:pimeloyl-ACP methyl ester carboxylesterase